MHQLIYYNLTIFSIDVWSPTQPLWSMTKHINCGTRYTCRWSHSSPIVDATIGPTSLIRINFDTMLDYIKGRDIELKPSWPYFQLMWDLQHHPHTPMTKHIEGGNRHTCRWSHSSHIVDAMIGPTSLIKINFDTMLSYIKERERHWAKPCVSKTPITLYLYWKKKWIQWIEEIFYSLIKIWYENKIKNS